LPFKILIAGDGPLSSEIQREINQQKLEDHIQLLGFVDNMQSFMNKIDILISVALWEGFGFVLAEGMVAKKPVLAFNLSSNSELVKDNQNGFLIPPNHLDLFADKLSLLIKDRDLRKKQGDWGYSFAKKNFEKDAQFTKLKDFLTT
jgi:glycosyltransferase involved in cell wall biosynthesis